MQGPLTELGVEALCAEGETEGRRKKGGKEGREGREGREMITHSDQ